MLTYTNKPGQSIDEAIATALILARQAKRCWLSLNGTKVCVWDGLTHGDVLRLWSAVRSREAALKTMGGVE